MAATIKPSDLAPDEKVTYSLGQATFDLTPSGNYKTEDRVVIAGAYDHPWLDVEEDAALVTAGQYRKGQIDPADDALSGVNSVAFDPKEIEKILKEQAEADVHATAIDAGEDQGEVVETGGVAETFAAEDAADEAPAPEQEKK